MADAQTPDKGTGKGQQDRLARDEKSAARERSRDPQTGRDTAPHDRRAPRPGEQA